MPVFPIWDNGTAVGSKRRNSTKIDMITASDKKNLQGDAQITTPHPD